MVCGKLPQSIVQNPSPIVLTRIPEGFWKVEAACFMFDPMWKCCIQTQRKKNQNKSERNLQDEKVEKLQI